MERYFICVIISTFVFIAGCQMKMPQEYIIHEIQLVPEGIAFSAKKDAFYLSSIAQSKIIKVDRRAGYQEDFIEPRAYGYAPGAGVWVDDQTNILFAISGYYRNNDSLSSLFAFDLNSRQLIKRYDIEEDENSHYLNDMVMDNLGNLYLTDTKASSVYILEQGSDSLKLFYKSKEIRYPNGIAISVDNSKLYIASYSMGVRSLDIETKKLLNGADTSGYSQRVDGLEFYKGHLYAIQKGKGRVSDNLRKLCLDREQSNITGTKIISDNNFPLTSALTFCIVKDWAVVIANSNLEYMDQVSFQFEKTDSMKNTKLRVYKLRE